MTLGFFCAAGLCQQIYKWKDAQGTVHYSEKAPPDGVEGTSMSLSGHAAGNSSMIAPSPPMTPTAEEEDALDIASKKQEEHLCAVAKQNLELLNSDAMIASDADLDTATQLRGDQRKAKRSEAVAQIARYCHEK
jgi:hypothetical protein